MPLRLHPRPARRFFTAKRASRYILINLNSVFGPVSNMKGGRRGRKLAPNAQGVTFGGHTTICGRDLAGGCLYLSWNIDYGSNLHGANMGPT